MRKALKKSFQRLAGETRRRTKADDVFPCGQVQSTHHRENLKPLSESLAGKHNALTEFVMSLVVCRIFAQYFEQMFCEFQIATNVSIESTIYLL